MSRKPVASPETVQAFFRAVYGSDYTELCVAAGTEEEVLTLATEQLDALRAELAQLRIFNEAQMSAIRLHVEDKRVLSAELARLRAVVEAVSAMKRSVADRMQKIWDMWSDATRTQRDIYAELKREWVVMVAVEEAMHAALAKEEGKTCPTCGRVGGGGTVWGPTINGVCDKMPCPKCAAALAKEEGT